MSKKWYQSRTLWVNVLGIVAFTVQAFTGFVIPAELQGSILAAANAVLRFDTDTVIRGFVAMLAVASVLAVSGCGAIRGFVGDNPSVVDATTALACGQAACRLEDEDRGLFSAQLSACSEIVAAGCSMSSRAAAQVGAAPDPSKSLVLPFPED